MWRKGAKCYSRDFLGKKAPSCRISLEEFRSRVGFRGIHQLKDGKEEGEKKDLEEPTPFLFRQGTNSHFSIIRFIESPGVRKEKNLPGFS